ncbi:hypothetical protein [Methanobrevibacter sp.]|uniref:hypothetical protein n=1 Tax=Methanobrevibacter sp. TaxID=66852 RepID=UPI00388E1E0A
MGSEKKLIIDDDYVEMVIGNEITRIAISEIQYVLLNRYSICFLPKKSSLKLIAVDIDYKDSVIQAIPDKSLIIDNSNLY